MAEKVADAAVQMLLEKLVSLAAEEVSLFRGFKNDLEMLKTTLKMIQKFLSDAMQRDIEKDNSVKQWLHNLDDVAYEADNLLDEFNYEILRRKVEIESQVKRKVCCFSFSSLSHVAFRREMGHKIKDLNTKFKNVNEEARSFGLQERLAVAANYLPPVMETNSIAVDPIFIGRDDVASQIVDVIINSADESKVSVAPIVGMGGLGKTTLARKTFNNPRIEQHFNERIWVSVSKKIDNKGLLIKVLESLSGVSDRESLGEEAIMKQLRSKLKDARYLLVLDDYLNDEKHEWDNFKNCVQGISSSKGNFIIVTTRHQNVESIVKTLEVPFLSVLSDDDCWEIIKTRTFPSLQVSEEFEIIGKEIARRCGGLPLAANVVGGSLQGKESDYWRSFLESSNFNPNDDVVSKVLKVSFDRLPSPSLKKCFAYCSIFPKGKAIKRDQLIQLWMAEGFLIERSDRDMESCGDDVYNILLQNFFLHEENVISQVRYIAVNHKCDIKKEQTIYLRTLFLKRYKGNLNTSVFLDCKYLHVLNLHGSDTEELTSSIDKLIHLRFLDLSNNVKIKKLPDSVCNLFNLQTLRLAYCARLIELPDRFKILVGLRHLVLGGVNSTSLKRMPLEIGKLTCLRTLEIFIVGNEEGRKIGELGNLKNLQGELTITNLEKVRGKAEAMGACLVEKQNLNFLEFEWSEPGKREGDNNDDEEVLEGLQPHQNLKRLAITYFYGDKFPAWTMKMNFPKLVEIFLKDCYKCQEMPTLGHLPLLKILKVYELRSVTSIGPSFYHEEHSSRAGVPFPALERFELHEMDSLTEWVEAGATAFPKLEFLEIWSCRELMTAPSHAFPSLRTLRIRNVWSEVPVTTICSNSSSLEELYIYDNSNLTSLPYKLFHNNQCLQSIEIQSCYNLRQVELSDALIKSLGELKIITCSNLASIQCQTTDYPISRLSNLEIIGCPMLAGFVSEMLLKKRTLSMENPGFWMNRLKRLDIDSFSEETVVNETLKGLREIHSLRELRLTGMRDWECLPDQLQHLTSLTHLTLVEFGIEALPQWFSNLSSLNYLCVLSCEKLMDLTCLQFLTELKTLDIWDCRLLGEALNYRSRAAHISHIPNISVDWMFTLYDV